LFRRIHKEQSAQRPERLSAERVLRLLIDDDRLASRVGDFRGGDKARETAADNDDVRVGAGRHNSRIELARWRARRRHEAPRLSLVRMRQRQHARVGAR